jgi:hypothetical protein
MATSRLPGPAGLEVQGEVLSARTPGPLGVNDAADPNVRAALGDTPGPLGVNDAAADAASVAPAVGGGGAATATSDTKAAEAAATDAEIEALDLSATAKAAAYDLKKKHPSVSFTSGRRDKAEQASAMASNVQLNANWIKETYAASAARDACQKWVDDNIKDKKTKDQIAQGLKNVLDGLTDAQLAQLSKHLSGDAFDVQPVEKDADAIKKSIRGLTGLGKFLEMEGGLVRWHAQF